MLCLNALFSGFQSGSDGPIASEMTLHFPSTLYALFNMTAMSTGFIVPFIAGIVLDSYEDPTAGWPVLFYSMALFTFISNLIFLLFAQAQRQAFDLVNEEEQAIGVTEFSSETRGDYGARRSITPVV